MYMHTHTETNMVVQYVCVYTWIFSMFMYV